VVRAIDPSPALPRRPIENHLDRVWRQVHCADAERPAFLLPYDQVAVRGEGDDQHLDVVCRGKPHQAQFYAPPRVVRPDDLLAVVDKRRSWGNACAVGVVPALVRGESKRVQAEVDLRSVGHVAQS